MGKGIPKGKDLIINIPPGTSKSTLVTILFPVWCWLHLPSHRIISSSYSGSLAMMHSVKSRNVIESDWFQQRYSHIFQLSPDQNAKTLYENDCTGARITASVGGSVTGKHADIFIVDDPIKVDEAMSELKLKECIKWWDLTVSTRLRDQKRSLKIVVMQRVNELDLTGYLLKTKPGRYEVICLPGELTKAVKPPHLRHKYVDGLLDPVRLDRQVLDNLAIDLGSLGFTGQINQAPSKMEGNLLKSKWFGRFTMSELMATAKALGRPVVWNFALDGAYTKDKLNDASAILSYCILENDIYIRAVMSVWYELPELLTFLQEFVHTNGYTSLSRLYIEPKANGLSTAQMLMRTSKLNIVIDKAPTTDKVSRVNGISPGVQAGRYHLLADSPWIESFMQQCTMFPNAEHDDEVDALTMAGDKLQNPNKVLSFEVL